MGRQDKLISLDALAGRIPDGSFIAVPRDVSGVPMAATRALIRRGARDLRLLAVPISGIQADLLIGAGCVRSIETSAVSMGEYGLAPRFTAAIKAGTIEIKDATCPAVHAALQAGEKGIPFMPLRGLIGSDVLANRPDWKVIDNPFGRDDPIVLLPALKPDVALFHAPLGDRFGNVWVGLARECFTMAHAAETTLATVEEIYDGNLLEDPRLAPGTLSDLYVTAVAEAARGAWPLALPGSYDEDGAHLAEYVRLAASDDGFAKYLARHVFSLRAAE